KKLAQGDHRVVMITSQKNAQRPRRLRLTSLARSGGVALGFRLVRATPHRDGGKRNRYHRSAIPAWTARVHLSVMGFDNGMGNSEPEPEPTMTGLDATHSLLEGIENSWQHFRFNPDSVVAHAHQDFSGIVGRLDVNHAAVRRKFDCILNHVPKDLHQPRIVGLGKMLSRG